MENERLSDRHTSNDLCTKRTPLSHSTVALEEDRYSATRPFDHANVRPPLNSDTKGNAERSVLIEIETAVALAMTCTRRPV